MIILWLKMINLINYKEYQYIFILMIYLKNYGNMTGNTKIPNENKVYLLKDSILILQLGKLLI